MSLPGAHRTETRNAARTRFYIRWTYGRGAGAPTLATFKASSRAEALALEQAAGADIAAAYAAARANPEPSAATIAGILARWLASEEFTRCAESTKAQRRRWARMVEASPLPPSGRPLGDLPSAALKDLRMIGRLELWRDATVAANGAREADNRVAVLRLALNWAQRRGLAPANPAAGMARAWHADRSDLIWEAHHVAAFKAQIAKAMDAAWATPATVRRAGKIELNTRRTRQIASIAAAHDAVMLALNTGMRLGDLAAHTWAEISSQAIAYTAQKGARRAKTARRARRVTVVPMLEGAARIYARRFEATGRDNPWIITSARGARYTPGALGQLVADYSSAAGVDRHLHDAKGTFATRMRIAGASNEEIAEMVDWSPGEVDTIARRYVSAANVATELLERLARRRAKP